MENMIKLNKIANYGNVADCYFIEDSSFLPKIVNIDTGKEIAWSQSGRSWRTAHVNTKNGKGTNISSEVIAKAYDDRHPF